jgi:predicted ferric reductase
VTLLFAFAHPLAPLVPAFIDDPQGAFVLLSQMLVRPRLLSGALSLTGLVLLVGFALLRTRRGVRYEFWRATHGPLAIVVAGLILHHALTNGDYSSAPLPEAAWLLLSSGELLTLFSPMPCAPGACGDRDGSSSRSNQRRTMSGRSFCARRSDAPFGFAPVNFYG